MTEVHVIMNALHQKETPPLPWGRETQSTHIGATAAWSYIPQSTQSDNDRFLAYIPSRVKFAWLVRVGGARPPLSLLLPSPVKLQWTLQLSGQIHWPCFISINICTLWYIPSFYVVFTRCMTHFFMSSEPLFLNVYGAKESIPRNEFRQPM